VKKLYIIIFSLVLITNSNAGTKKKIIENLKNTKNINFEFEQNINGKIEKGNCTIKYPKKIFCKYVGIKRKILVSDSKMLVIKTKSSYYRYSLRKTYLNLILDKNFLINKILDTKEKIFNKTYLKYKIFHNNIEIDIIFNNQTYDLVGWEMIDAYQNINSVFISIIKKNQKIKKNLFTLPAQI
tara:strand:+ start:260 stop:808 length:549 start_codon:yes stop_codon:yes gene_type:complete